MTFSLRLVGRCNGLPGGQTGGDARRIVAETP